MTTNHISTLAASGGSAIRYHGFDALRASMMMLGVYLHALCAYATMDHIWWYKDARTGVAWDLQCLFIHVFRLPMFFVMCGFFAALLVGKRGLPGFWSNRLLRIGAPLVLFGVVLVAILRPMEYLSRELGRNPDALSRVWIYVSHFRFFTPITTMHLWFLVVLMCLYPLAPIFQLALAGRFGTRVDAVFGRLVASPAAPLAMAAVTFLTLLPMHSGILDTPDRIPAARILAAYAVFFTFGWLLFRRRDVLGVFGARAWHYLAGALVFAAANLAFVKWQLDLRPASNQTAILGTAASGALFCWLMIFALMGLFLRYANRANERVRWISDSAYWIYLVHPVALFGMQLLLRDSQIAPSLKLVLTLAPSLGILFASYEWMVRGRWLGWLLNGTPRAATKAANPPQPVRAPAVPQEA
jgi:glucans biosynthesis protein C